MYLNTLSKVLDHTTSKSERLVNNELKITRKRDYGFSQLFCLLVYDADRWKSSMPFFRVKKSKTLDTEADPTKHLVLLTQRHGVAYQSLLFMRDLLLIDLSGMLRCWTH